MSIKPPFIRTAYNYDMDKVSQETGLACPEETLTQQQFLEESDINFIAERYGLYGEMPQVRQPPSYGDFTGIFDFQTAQNAVRNAVEQFMQLPAKMRARFDNSPQKLLEFLDDTDNRDQAIALGLIPKPEAAPAAAPGGDTPTPKDAPQGGTKDKP